MHMRISSQLFVLMSNDDIFVFPPTRKFLNGFLLFIFARLLSLDTEQGADQQEGPIRSFVIN
jgi:hypothetical protein